MTSSQHASQAMSENQSGYCPHCNANLDGDLVIETFMEQGKTRKEALESAAYYSGWNEHGELNRWGRKIGISSMEHDRVMEWQCPDCHKRWKRF